MKVAIELIQKYASNFLASLIVIIIAIVLWKIVSQIIKRSKQKIDDTQGKKTTYLNFAYNAFKVILLIITVLSLLQVNGANVSGILAGLGIMSAIIGLAVQDELKDAVMGIHFLTDGFFHVGDVVEYNGEKAVVQNFNLKVVRLEALADNSLITVCNRNITEIKICSDIMYVDVPLPYDSDEATVYEVFQTCCNELLLDSQVKECIVLGLQSFDEYSIAYRFKICCDPFDMPKIRRKLFSSVYLNAKANNIDIPFPRIDIHQL